MRTSWRCEAGYDHSLGLKSDGTIVVWGDNSYGQCNVPAPNADFVAIAAGLYHSLGLKSDGTIVAWGGTPMASAMSRAECGLRCRRGGPYHSLGLKSDGAIVAWGETIMANVTSPERTSTS